MTEPARLMRLEWPQDYDRLHPNAQHWALLIFAHLREHPLRGTPLHDGAGRPKQQGLVGCRRVKQRHGSKKLRIVYRVLPSDDRPHFVEVIAVGNRSDVYETAARRLKEKRGLAA